MSRPHPCVGCPDKCEIYDPFRVGNCATRDSAQSPKESREFTFDQWQAHCGFTRPGAATTPMPLTTTAIKKYAKVGKKGNSPCFCIMFAL